MGEDSPELLLEIVNPSGQLTRMELRGQRLAIGRSPECEIVLESTHVSRRHAELTSKAEGGWILRDLASRNGTRVNGHPITEQTIEPGDRIQIGDFELRIRSRAVAQQGEDGHNTMWSLHEGATTAFMTLIDGPQARLRESHLALVSGLSTLLLETADREDRLTQLCRTLVESELRCQTAVALRVDLSDPSKQPTPICPYQLRAGSAQSVGTGAVQVPRAVVEAAVSGGQPILAGSAESDPTGPVSIVCPLRVQEKIADILYVIVPRQHGTVDWLALVALASEQFKKAELQIEARQNVQANADLHHELQKAHQMQMSLIPRNPAVPGLEIAIGFEPCRWIGGDYANVLPMADGRVLLAVADACGKGLTAAMVASGVHSIVHSAIRSGAALGDAVGSLNQYLLESMHLQSFVTLVGAMLDPRSGKALCVNAGHPPMLIVDPTGKVTELRYGHNPPLGVMPMTVELDSAELNAGELLVLYTDGLSELRDARGKMLGLDGIKSRLSQIYSANSQLPLTELCQQLNQTLDEIRGAGAATDDRSFLLARRVDVK
jgi:phosphoserine phosphatase RsbU/P